MSDRDELAKVTDAHLADCWTHEGGFECRCGWKGADHYAHRLDVILADGWRKVDPTADTTVEWGVRYRVHWDDEDRHRVRRSRKDAEEFVDDLRWMYDPGDWVIRPVVVSRTVIRTAWTKPEEQR